MLGQGCIGMLLVVCTAVLSVYGVPTVTSVSDESEDVDENPDVFPSNNGHLNFLSNTPVNPLTAIGPQKLIEYPGYPSPSTGAAVNKNVAGQQQTTPAGQIRPVGQVNPSPKPDTKGGPLLKQTPTVGQQPSTKPIPSFILHNNNPPFVGHPSTIKKPILIPGLKTNSAAQLPHPSKPINGHQLTSTSDSSIKPSSPTTSIHAGAQPSHNTVGHSTHPIPPSSPTTSIHAGAQPSHNSVGHVTHPIPPASKLLADSTSKQAALTKPPTAPAPSVVSSRITKQLKSDECRKLCILEELENGYFFHERLNICRCYLVGSRSYREFKLP